MFSISDDEKIAIRAYFENPSAYAELTAEALPFPDYTKITRPVPNEHDELQRYFAIPGENGQERRIPILRPHTSDPGVHAATRVYHNILYHQNKGTLDDVKTLTPAERPEWYSNGTESETPSEKALREGENQRNAFFYGVTVHYDQYVNGHDTKIVVKTLMDDSGREFRLKSRLHSGEKLDAQSVYNAFNMATELYVLKPIQKERVYALDKPTYKTIEITYYQGEDLWRFLSKRELTPAQKDQLSYALLKAYLTQIAHRCIVHTDIKAPNICIKVNGDAFEITFIDYEGAFYEHASAQSMTGTAGYLAPEFFKTQADYTHQMSVRRTNEARYFKSLKTDYLDHFSTKTDIYALGRVLLSYIKLSEENQFFRLAQSMCAIRPENRPTAEDINRMTSSARGYCFRFWSTSDKGRHTEVFAQVACSG